MQVPSTTGITRKSTNLAQRATREAGTPAAAGSPPAFDAAATKERTLVQGGASPSTLSQARPNPEGTSMP